MAENQILLLDSTVTIKDKDQTVPAVTAVVEGNFKNILEYIMEKDKSYTKYNEVVSQALFLGIDEILKGIQKDQPSAE